MYTKWGEGGPDGSVWDVSPSGWFDRISFNKFFDKVGTYPISINYLK
jgi:hypothetical protein